MEFTIDSVANKMILVIIVLSALVAAGGAVFFLSYEAIPFAIGVAMAMGVNIAKVILLKQAIKKTVDIESSKSAKIFFQIRYFLRFALTVAVLFAAAIIPDNIVNLWGAVIGIFMHPLSVYAMRFFVPADTVMPIAPAENSDPVQDSINKLESIGQESIGKED